MTGLFGGGNQSTYVPQAPTFANQTGKKGATDLEKLNKEYLSRKKAYGSDNKFSPNNLLSGDTTLSSGSLLSLGGTLGG